MAEPLITMARSLIAQQTPVLVIAPRRSPLRSLEGTPGVLAVLGSELDAEYLRVFAGYGFPAALLQFFLQLRDADDAGRKMVGTSELSERRVGRQVQHIFDPVRPVRHLHHHPIDAIIRISALPI